MDTWTAPHLSPSMELDGVQFFVAPLLLPPQAAAASSRARPTGRSRLKAGRISSKTSCPSVAWRTPSAPRVGESSRSNAEVNGGNDPRMKRPVVDRHELGAELVIARWNRDPGVEPRQ